MDNALLMFLNTNKEYVNTAIDSLKLTLYYYFCWIFLILRVVAKSLRNLSKF